MKKTLFALSICSVLTIALPAFACTKPEAKPEIPDANSVVTAQLVKANNEVKAYVKAMEDYLGCAKLSRGEETKALKDLKDFAEEFNVVVRAFKAKGNG